MAKGKLRKDNLSIKLEDGTIMNAERDNTAFRKTFQDWENMAKGLSGETIGNLRSPNSLYDMFKEQGISGRVMGNSGPKNRNKGGPEIFKMIRKIKSSRAYSTMELEYLETLDKLMDEYAKPDSEMNPANISFENPTDWTEKGTVTSTNTVYGHYRTEDYQDNRADKVSKDFPEGQDVPAVNSTWYAESEGEAKPPFWQAIYGDGTGDAFTGNSLHLCIKEAIEGFNNLEYEVSKKTPINFAKLGAWQKALQIDGISDIVKEWLEKPNRNGNFSSKLCLNEIVKTEHSMEGNESEVVKNIMQMPGMKQDIKKIWVSMARRQVLNMAYNLANKSNIPVHWTDSGKNVLKFGEKVDPQKKKPKKKDSMKKMLKGGSSNMSWKDILRKGDAWEMEQTYGMSSADIVDMFADENDAAAEVVETEAKRIVNKAPLYRKGWDKLSYDEAKDRLKKELDSADLEYYDESGMPEGDAHFAVDDWFMYEYKEFYDDYIKEPENHGWVG